MFHLNYLTHHWQKIKFVKDSRRGRILTQIQMECVTASNATTQRQGSMGYGIHSPSTEIKIVKLFFCVLLLQWHHLQEFSEISFYVFDETDLFPCIPQNNERRR